jgi:PAS domain S-box-containing protein
MDLQIESNSSNDSNPFSYAPKQGWADEYLTERYDPPALSLDERGMIQDCSKSFEKLFGFQRRDLVWQHFSRLLPQFTEVDLIQSGQLNPFLNYLCHCGHRYQAQNRQGDTFSCNLSFVRVEFGGRRSLRLIVNPASGLES